MQKKRMGEGTHGAGGHIPQWKGGFRPTGNKNNTRIVIDRTGFKYTKSGSSQLVRKKKGVAAVRKTPRTVQ